MKITILILAIIILVAALSKETQTTKQQLVSLSLDLQESRRREELLGQAVRDLSYQIDVMAKTMKGQ